MLPQDEGGMEVQEDPEHPTDGLMQYDSERLRVTTAVSEYNEREEPAPEDEDDEMAVPTEMLQGDVDTSLELPARFEAGRLASYIADRPNRVITYVVGIACICLVWIALTPGERFSVGETLFQASGKPGVRQFYELGKLARLHSAKAQLVPGYVFPEDRTHRRLLTARLASDSDALDARAARAAPAALPAIAPRRRTEAAGAAELVTLVYERRGTGTRDMLTLRQLKAVHDFERELWGWMVEEDVCWRVGGGSPASDGCRPIDSIENYLYPHVALANASAGGTHELRFDGRMHVEDDSDCADPPFSAHDVDEVVTWLSARGHDGFLEDGGSLADQQLQAGDKELDAATDAADNADGSRYLRSTVYLDREKMDGAKWFALANRLYKFSQGMWERSWYVQLYYGGGYEMMTAELLVMLMYDLWLLLLSIILIALFMRVYFGQWRLAGLASAQIALSFPVMYFVVCVLLGQRPLSAFAAASFAVVIGVSADNIFVLHETWGQSRMLRQRGQRATAAQRVEWTIRQASVPLFYANATTAGSLLISCVSPIASIVQFGLCGGTLIFVNFTLVLLYLPAILVLEERGGLNAWGPPPDRLAREREQQDKVLKLQAVHAWLWERRTLLPACFAIGVAILTPAALSVSPGADSSFTFAPDPAVEAIISHARASPSDAHHLFRSVEGEHTTEWGLMLRDTADAPTAYYTALITGTWEPPITPPSGGWISVSLAFLLLYDTSLLHTVAYVIMTGVPVGWLQPPTADPGPIASLSLTSAAAATLVFALSLLALSWWVCDFARSMRSPLGDVLSLLLLLHGALYAKLSRIASTHQPWGLLGVSEYMTRKQVKAELSYAAASAGYFLGAFVVFVAVHGWPSADINLHWPGFSWQWDWSCFLGLSLIWSYNACVLSLAAVAALNDEQVMYFRPRPEYKMRLLVASTCHSYGGWALLVFSGLPIARNTSFRGECDLLAIYLLATALCHVSCFRVILRGSPTALLAPSHWSESSRGLAILAQLFAIIMFFWFAILAWLAAHNPTACDDNDDGSMSLHELADCIPDIDLDWISLHLPSLYSVILGVCLAALWLIDSCLASVITRVLATGEPDLCFGPLETSFGPRSRKLMQRMRVASVCFGLSGSLVALLSLSPRAFAAAFGPNAIIAYNLLGISLLIHSPPLATLTRVFRTNTSEYILRPTTESRESSRPQYAAAFGSLFCFVAGLAILITQNSIYFSTPDLAWPDWDGLDGTGFLLTCVLLADALTLLHLAAVQRNGPWSCMRPLPSASDEELGTLGRQLEVAGGVIMWFAALVLLLALHPYSNSIFGRAAPLHLPVFVDLLLTLHAVGLYGLGYLGRRNIALGVFEPPPRNEPPLACCTALPRDWRAKALHEVLHAAAALSMGIAVGRPLLDGLRMWEAVGNVLFAVIVAGGVLTHGLYTGGVVAEAVNWSASNGHHTARDQRSFLRRAALLVTSAGAVAVGACFAMAAADGGELVLEYHYFLPLRYMLTCALAAFAFVNYVPLVAAMEVWYTGMTVCGFSREDAPHAKWRQPSAIALLVGALTCAVLGGALTATASKVIRLDDGSGKYGRSASLYGVNGSTGALPQVPVADTEVCALFWGVEGHDEDDVAILIDGFDMSTPAAQLELLATCKLVLRDSSPLHTAGHDQADPCLMEELHDWAVRKGKSFPIPQADFDASLLDLLSAPHHTELRQLVGLAKGKRPGATSPLGDRHFAWLVQNHLRAKHAFGGVQAVALVADPMLLIRYRDEWRSWIAGLPGAVRAPPERPLWKDGVHVGTNPAPGAPDFTLPPASESVLSFGISRCAKWSVLETVLAFFSSVFTALCVTPVFSMCAIALFARSLIVSYLALYTLLAMVLALLGIMHVIGLPLGVTGALALSLVIGMSVDYLIHLAHAYKNSLFADRFYKSRAAIFARTGSIISAVCTTLLALTPLLFSHLLPLREFGQIFFLVTLISFAFSIAFLTALMAIGPLRTRSGAPLNPAARQAAEEDTHEIYQEDARMRVTEAHSAGDGWALQLNVGDQVGPRDNAAHGVDRGRQGMNALRDADGEGERQREQRGVVRDDDDCDEML